MKNLSVRPKAPRRFKVIDEKNDIWEGGPSVPYGVVRKLAHEQRKLSKDAYCRVLYSDAARRGDPWGGLALEANGEIFHFTTDKTTPEFPTYFDSDKYLTASGKEEFAKGIPGALARSKDWRWVQDEIDITTLLSEAAILDIVDYYRKILQGTIAMPTFQAQTWAKRLEVPINPDFHNCTTIILAQVRQKTGLALTQRMPLPAVDALQALVGNARSALDSELNDVLHMDEPDIEKLLQKTAAGREAQWAAIAKGDSLTPAWLTWESLRLANL